jgi:hypothetical protein
MNIEIPLLVLLTACNNYKRDAGIYGMIFWRFILQGWQYLDYLASNRKMIDELERIWEEAVVA